MVALAAVVLAGVGCGRLGFDAITGDAGDPGDAGGDGPTACDVSAPFGTPQLVAGLDSLEGDITLRLQANELEGVFWSLRTSSADIYAATRPDLASAFTVTTLPVLNDPDNVDADPTVSRDGSFVVFASGRPGGAGGFDLYEAQKLGATYTAPALLAGLNSAGVDSQPNWSPAESALYFSSDRSGVSRIYRAVRTGPATYGAPQAVPDLTAGTGEEQDPAPSSNGLVMYFRSTRPGGPGGGDAFVATRSGLGAPFGPAALVDVNSPVIDGPSFLSPDLCRLYLTSDRSGRPKIYVAAR